MYMGQNSHCGRIVFQISGSYSDVCTSSSSLRMDGVCTTQSCAAPEVCTRYCTYVTTHTHVHRCFFHQPGILPLKERKKKYSLAVSPWQQHGGVCTYSTVPRHRMRRGKKGVKKKIKGEKKKGSYMTSGVPDCLPACLPACPTVRPQLVTKDGWHLTCLLFIQCVSMQVLSSLCSVLFVLHCVLSSLGNGGWARRREGLRSVN